MFHLRLNKPTALLPSGLLLELLWTHVTQMAVQTSSIVKRFDPLKDTLSSFLTSRVLLLVNKVFLWARKESLRHRFDPAVPFPTHVATYLMASQRWLKRSIAMLTATDLNATTDCLSHRCRHARASGIKVLISMAFEPVHSVLQITYCDRMAVVLAVRRMCKYARRVCSISYYGL